MTKILLISLLALSIFSCSAFLSKDTPQEDKSGLGTTETGWPTINGIPLGVGPTMKYEVDEHGHAFLHLYGDSDETSSDDSDSDKTQEKKPVFGTTETGWPTINGIPLGTGPAIKSGDKSGSSDSNTGSSQGRKNVFGRTETGWPTLNGKSLGVGPAMRYEYDGQGHVTLHLYGDDDDKKTGSDDSKSSETQSGLGKTETGWPTINGVPLGVGPRMRYEVDEHGHPRLHLFGEDDDKTNSDQSNSRMTEEKKPVFGTTETGWPTISGIPLGPGPVIPKDDNKGGSGETKTEGTQTGNVFGKTETGWPTMNGHPLGVGPVIPSHEIKDDGNGNTNN